MDERRTCLRRPRREDSAGWPPSVPASSCSASRSAAASSCSALRSSSSTGSSLLWVTLVAVLLQTVFNTELMRYTLATGEPVFTGFMRTRPSSTFWAWFYAVLYFLQIGWPAWAGTAAGAIFFLFTQRAGGTAGRFDHLLHRRRDVPGLRGRALGGPAHRAHARDAQLGAHRLHPRRLPGAGRAVRSRRDLARCGSRLRGLRFRAPAASISFRRAPTSSCSARWSAYSGAGGVGNLVCRTGRATRATAWESAPATSPARSAAGK